MSLNFADQFVKDFNEPNTNFSFIKFFNTFCGPDKSPFEDNTDEILILKYARNVLFINLSLNKAFLKAEEENPRTIDQTRTIYENLNLLMIRTKQEISIDDKAQILFLVHLSKLDTDNETFIDLFRNIGSIRVEIDLHNYKFCDDLVYIFQKLLTNGKINRTISEVIQTVAKNKSTYNITSTKLVFFHTLVSQLHGFAGINEIYVNIDLLNVFDHKLSKKYKHDDKTAILNLIFTKVIVHELSHVALRYTFNDFNISTPKFNDTTQKLDEAGCIAENLLFKGRIDWMASAEKGFDLDYCKAFLQSLSTNQEFEFDQIRSKTVINDSDYFCMAFNMSLKKNKKTLFL